MAAYCRSCRWTDCYADRRTDRVGDGMQDGESHTLSSNCSNKHAYSEYEVIKGFKRGSRRAYLSVRYCQSAASAVVSDNASISCI